MKLWIDDVRPAPAGYTHTATTAAEAIAHLQHAKDEGEPVEHIAFDHDLGEDMGVARDVRPVVRWLWLNDVVPESASVHTSNPWGRKWLVAELADMGVRAQ